MAEKRPVDQQRQVLISLLRTSDWGGEPIADVLAKATIQNLNELLQQRRGESRLILIPEKIPTYTFWATKFIDEFRNDLGTVFSANINLPYGLIPLLWIFQIGRIKCFIDLHNRSIRYPSASQIPQPHIALNSATFALTKNIVSDKETISPLAVLKINGKQEFYLPSPSYLHSARQVKYGNVAVFGIIPAGRLEQVLKIYQVIINPDKPEVLPMVIEVDVDDVQPDTQIVKGIPEPHIVIDSEKPHNIFVE
jgi:hypothetical protein